MATKFWVHISVTTGELLDGGGFPLTNQDRSFRVTAWPSKEAILKFCHRHFKGETLRDTPSRVEIDLPADACGPARTLAFIEMTIDPSVSD